MKKMFIVILLLSYITAFSQPQKGATKIIIRNTYSAKENYELIGKTLMQNDYFIDAKDGDFFYVKTQQKPINKWTGIYFLNIVSAQNEIQISGMMKSGQEITIYGVTAKSEFEPICFKGMNSSLYKSAFKNMETFASKFEGIREYK